MPLVDTKKRAVSANSRTTEDKLKGVDVIEYQVRETGTNSAIGLYSGSTPGFQSRKLSIDSMDVDVVEDEGSFYLPQNTAEQAIGCKRLPLKLSFGHKMLLIDGQKGSLVQTLNSGRVNSTVDSKSNLVKQSSSALNFYRESGSLFNSDFHRLQEMQSKRGSLASDRQQESQILARRKSAGIFSLAKKRRDAAVERENAKRSHSKSNSNPQIFEQDPTTLYAPQISRNSVTRPLKQATTVSSWSQPSEDHLSPEKHLLPFEKKPGLNLSHTKDFNNTRSTRNIITMLQKEQLSCKLLKSHPGRQNQTDVDITPGILSSSANVISSGQGTSFGMGTGTTESFPVQTILEEAQNQDQQSRLPLMIHTQGQKVIKTESKSTKDFSFDQRERSMTRNQGTSNLLIQDQNGQNSLKNFTQTQSSLLEEEEERKFQMQLLELEKMNSLDAENELEKDEKVMQFFSERQKYLHKYRSDDDRNSIFTFSPVQEINEKGAFKIPSPSRGDSTEDANNQNLKYLVKKGNVFRYKLQLGKKPLYIERYLELYNDCLQYKKSSQQQGYLFSIPLEEIQEIKRVQLDSVHPNQDRDQDHVDMALFEVCLRTDFESLYFVNQIQGYIENDKQKQVWKLRRGGRIVKQKKKKKLQNSQKRKSKSQLVKTLERGLPGGKVQNYTSAHLSLNELSNSVEKVREKFQLTRDDVNVNIEVSGSPQRPSKVVINKLSPETNKYKSRSYNSKLQEITENRNSSQKKRGRKSKSKIADLINGKNLDIKQKGKSRKNSSAKKIKTSSPITSKVKSSSNRRGSSYSVKYRVVQGHGIVVPEVSEFQPNSPSQKSKRDNLKFFQWSARALDFYDAERRFIFGCKDAKKAQKWIDKIQLLLGNQNHESTGFKL